MDGSAEFVSVYDRSPHDLCPFRSQCGFRPFTGSEFPDLVGEAVPALLEFDRVVGPVRRQEHTVVSAQRTLRGERLLLEHIECEKDVFRVDGFDHSGFIHHLPPGDVHEERVVLHESELFGADHVECLGGAAARENDDFRPGKRFGERTLPESGGRGLPGGEMVRDHRDIGTEAFQQFGDRAADPAVTDHRGRPPGENPRARVFEAGPRLARDHIVMIVVNPQQ